MKSKKLPIIIIMTTIVALTIIVAGCKKNNVSKDSPPIVDPVIPPDSAKIVYIADKDYQNLPAGSTGTTIAAYDAATGALLNTFKYVHDPKAASYNSAIQYISLTTGNGFLYDIEPDKINALDANTGAVRWTDSIKNNAGAVLHDQTFYGISVGDVTGFSQFSSANNFVYAIDATKGSNAFLWKYPISLADIGYIDYLGGPSIYSPMYYNGLVYVMSDSNHLIALNAATGALKWTFTFPPYTAGGNARYAFSQPVISNGIIYCSVGISTSVNGQSVYLLDATSGAQKGVFNADGIPNAIVNGLIVSPTAGFDKSTGASKWDNGIGSTFGVWNGNVVTQRDSSFYYSNPSGYPHSGYSIAVLIALFDAATGKEKWSRISNDGSGINKNVVVGNTLYTSGSDDLSAIDLYTGKPKWTRPGVMPYQVIGICVVGTSGTAHTPYIP